jgi:hypothetical protein
MRDARWLTGAGLAAVAASVAHAGPAGVTDGRALLAALAGSAVAAGGLSLAASRWLDARRQTRAVAAGAFAVTRSSSSAPFSVVVAAMLVLQTAAHVGLLLAGVHAGAGATAAPVLHLVLAVVAAWLVVSVDRLIASAVEALAAAVEGLIELLTAVRIAPVAAPVLIPVRRPDTRPFAGRAPPSTF